MIWFKLKLRVSLDQKTISYFVRINGQAQSSREPGNEKITVNYVSQLQKAKKLQDWSFIETENEINLSVHIRNDESK